MSQVVLINCLGKNAYRPRRIEHLGLSSLSSYLQAQRIGVCLFDGVFHKMDDKALVKMILNENPKLVGFSVFATNEKETLGVIRKLRRVGFEGHVTLGGHHTTFHYRTILQDNPGVDTIVLGEGEGALLDLVNRVHRKEDWQLLPNIVCQHNGQIIVNSCRPLISDLGKLPQLDRSAYGDLMKREKVASMISSRGCYGKCSFCSIRSFYGMSKGRRWRSRSPADIVDEMEKLVRKQGIELIGFMDDEFFGPGRIGKERALAIGEEIIRRKLSVDFTIACRPDNLEREILRVLQKAGLILVDVGVESWVPRQLELYGKDTTVEKNLAAEALLNDLGLGYRFYIMPIDPYVTVEEFLVNIGHIERIGLEHFVGTTFLTRLNAFRGTAVWDHLVQDGLVDDKARDSFLGSAYDILVDDNFWQRDPFVRKISKAHRTWVNRVRQIFTDEPNLEETRFGADLVLATGGACLDMLKTAMTQRLSEGSSVLDKEIAKINRTLSRVASARRRRVFQRFETRRFQINGKTVSYPSEGLRQVAKALTCIETA